jgi:hypothetical protein
VRAVSRIHNFQPYTVHDVSHPYRKFEGHQNLDSENVDRLCLVTVYHETVMVSGSSVSERPLASVVKSDLASRSLSFPGDRLQSTRLAQPRNAAEAAAAAAAAVTGRPAAINLHRHQAVGRDKIKKNYP